jgi:hypothetical protein
MNEEEKGTRWKRGREKKITHKHTKHTQPAPPTTTMKE